MPARIPWSQHEVALLFDAYLRAAKGADLQQTAAQLSVTLREMAQRAGVDIDETYRNVNGIKMQLANVQYLFTGGVKGLSGASGMIRQMYEQYQADPSKYQSILKEAILMTGTPSTSVQDAFFAYAQGKIGLPTRILSDYLQKAADYCHLKQPLLGITDVQEVRRIQQKVAEGKLLRFRYGKDAQTIRNVTQLYYNFVKSYRETKAQPATQLGSTPSVTKEEPPQLTAEAVDVPPALEVGEVMQDADEPADLNEEISETDPVEEAVSDNAAVSSDELWVDFSVDNSYLFTKPNYYIYKGNRYDVKSWNRLYVEVCGLLFADYHDAFMGSMNGDILGYNALIFADEQNYRRMRTPKPFAPGYYLESNLDATSIVRKLCGLHRLFNVGDALQISYRTVVGYQPSQPKTHKEIGNGDQLSVDSNYNWHRDGLRLMDFSQEISYAFTQPEAYQYNGVTKRVSKWGKLYADLCGALFEDHHDAFMGIMNGDIPGYNALAFADEQHKTGMRVARQFAPGYYLESNIDATTIVRKIRGLHKLFGIGDKLRISYHATGNGGNDISAKEDHSDEWIIEQLKANGITYQDKRSRDGCLWIVGGHELDAFARDCKVHGYTLSFKADGCKTYPDKAVWWTKDQPESQEQIAIDVDEDSLDSFKQFLQEKQNLADRTANGYASAIRSVESYIQQHNLNARLIGSNADEVQAAIVVLMLRPDFVKLNQDRHHQFGAAMAQYVSYLKTGMPSAGTTDIRKPAKSSNTIKDAVVTVLQGASSPMSASEILEQIRRSELYQFNTDNPLSVVTSTIRQHCVGIEPPDRSGEKPFRMISVDNGRPKFYLKEDWPEQIAMIPSRMTIKDAVIAVLRDATEPMSTPAILEQIQRRGLYQFNTEKPLPIVLNTIKLNCAGVSDLRLSWEKTFRFLVGEDGKQRYLLANSSAQDSGSKTDTIEEDDSMTGQVRDHILSFVSESFPHGIRPASIIDINKLKRIYQSQIGEEIPAGVDVTSLLKSIGLQNGEKIYFLSEDQKQSLHDLITGIVENGHRVIYYSELLALHGELFETCHIYESPLMRTVLSSVAPAYIYKAEWMLADRDATEIEEITRAFGEDVVLTYQQLKSRCPYLTLDVIKWALSRSDRFVWSSPETYAQVDLIELDQAEISEIVNRILPLIREKGYFSLAQLSIEDSCGMNPQVSSSAVRDAIYNRYMSNEFTRNGLIVKLPGIQLNTYELIKSWLNGLDQVTLAEVEDYERELTGHHAVLGIVAASNTMVRIDHDHYVSDASIQFDVGAVDRAIALFAGNRVIPISAITSFTSFPEVPGYAWNLYLVESFLRRFSKRFTIDGGPAQMSYVGGICSADMSFENYEDRLAHAVIQDGIALTEDAVGRYLTERKYILRRSETVRKTLERARILNEQRGESSVRI